MSRTVIWMQAIVLCLAASLSQVVPADLVVTNARIWSAGQVGFADFAAVVDGRFVHVGPPDEGFVGPRTQRVDAGGCVVIPGLIDSHIHMLGGGEQLSMLWLRAAVDRGDFIRRVDRWSATLDPGAWILGGRWSTESWPDRSQPVKGWVDPVSGDHPLYLYSVKSARD